MQPSDKVGSVGNLFPGQLFCEPRFAKGSGLGNRLFPWARCKVFSQLHSAEMLRPIWFSLHIGPLLRGVELEGYHRQVMLAGLFPPSDEYIRGFKRIWVKIRTKKFPEPNNLSDRPITPSHSLVFFDGEGNHFSDLYEWRAFIHDKLRSEAHPKCLSVSEANTA